MNIKNIWVGIGVGLGALLHADGSYQKYVELKPGYCIPQKTDGVSYKQAPLLNSEIGIKYNNWRLGFQLGVVQYKNKEIDNRLAKHYATIFNNDAIVFKNTRFTALSAMLNVYYDYKLQEQFSFYVGAGCGFVRLKYHFYEILDSNSDYNLVKYALAAQVMGGIAYEIDSHWTLSLGYRCMKPETVLFSHSDFDDEIKSLKTPYLHALEFGLRYQF